MSTRLSITIDKEADGFHAYCKELDGCYSTGASLGEAIANIQKAIKLYLEAADENGIRVPVDAEFVAEVEALV